MANGSNNVKQIPWKVEVLQRLDRVEEDVRRALSARNWALNQNEGKAGANAAGYWIVPLAGRQRSALMNEADAVVATTFEYINKTREILRPYGWWQLWPRARDWLTGALLMSAFTSLHAAEGNRVLLLSGDQLAAILPSIRTRAAAYLAVNDPRRVALDSVPDRTAPAHQALARVQEELVRSVTQAQPQPQVQPQAQDQAPPPDQPPTDQPQPPEPA